MATSGKSLAITAGIYGVVALIVFLLFSWWRTTKLTRKFFSPKLYMKDPGGRRPPPIKPRFAAWLPQVLFMSEADVIRCGGVDAAVYIKILRMGFELFCIISFLTLAIILPINCTGGEVDKLMANPQGLESNYLYQFLVPNSTSSSGSSNSDTGSDAITTLPDIYNDTNGDPPPGMVWWNYNSDIDPRAWNTTPYEYFLITTNATYAEQFRTYGWRWLQSYQQIEYKFTSLDKTTMSNVSAESPRLWAHAVVTWVVSFFVYWWLWKYNKEGLRLRIFYLLNQPPGAESHTVLVQDVPGVAYGTIPQRADGTLLKIIPKSIKEKAYQQTAMLAAKGKGGVSAKFHKVRSKAESGGKGLAGDGDIDAANLAASRGSSSDSVEIDAATGRWEMRDAWADAVEGIHAHDGSVHGMVEEEFRRIYGEDLSQVHMVHNTSKLDPLVAEYEKLQLACTDLVDNYISLRRRGKPLKPKKVTVLGAAMGAWGREKYGVKPVKVDAFEFYRDRLTELRRAILEEQGKALEPHNVFPAAFVTFRRRTSQVVAARTLMSEDMSAWRAQAAPRAEELVWPNLGLRIWERSGRSIAMYAAFIAMAAFFMIPVAAVQGLLSLNSFVGFVNSIPIAGALLTGMLPGLALKIFLALVPMFITMMNRFAGMVSQSQIDLGLTSRFFYFQVITLFLGSFIAGTFANQMKQFISDPGSIITIFGTSAPQTAIFFMTYILLEALLTSSLTLMRIIPLIIFYVKSALLASTERAKERLWQNQLMAYGTVVPNDTMAFLLGLTFCTICPLIAPVTLGYFMFNYIVWKYQQVYTYTPRYQSGGLVWVRVFDQCMLGMIMFHIIMVGILGIKKSIGAPIFVLILLAFDFVFWVAAHARFWRPQECLSLISAADMDSKEAAAAKAAAAYGAPKSVDAEVRDRYLSPSFKFSHEDHDRALDEAARMAAVLAGGEDDKLFAAAEAGDEAQADLEAAVDAKAEGGKAPDAPAAAAAPVVAAAAPPVPREATEEQYADATSMQLPDGSSYAASFVSAQDETRHEP